jgi:hypothetical protein
VIAVVNFPPKQIGPFLSEVPVLGAYDAAGEVLLRPDADARGESADLELRSAGSRSSTTSSAIAQEPAAADASRLSSSTKRHGDASSRIFPLLRSDDCLVVNESCDPACLLARADDGRPVELLLVRDSRRIVGGAGAAGAALRTRGAIALAGAAHAVVVGRRGRRPCGHRGAVAVRELPERHWPPLLLLHRPAHRPRPEDAAYRVRRADGRWRLMAGLHFTPASIGPGAGVECMPSRST